MKYALPIIAAAGLVSAQWSDYTILEGRSDLAQFEPHLTIIARALEDIDAIDNGLYARAAGSDSRRSSVSMGSLSRSNSWESVHAATDSRGKVQSSGNGHNQHSNANPTHYQQGVNAAHRAGAYMKKDPAGAASTGLSMAGAGLGAIGAAAGAGGQAHIAAGCAAGAAGCNAASGMIDKSRAASKAAAEKRKGKRDLYVRALLEEFDYGFPEIEARSYDDADLFADEYYY